MQLAPNEIAASVPALKRLGPLIRRQLKLGAATAETWGKTSHRSPQRACALANRLTFELGQPAQDRHMSRRCAVRCLYLRLDPAPELESHLRQKAVSLDQPRQRIGGDDWRADR